MRLAHSFWLKTFVTTVAAVSFVWLLEVTILDSRHAVLPLGFLPFSSDTEVPSPGSRATFTATAYCKGPVTAAGTAVREGVVASDPSLLPIGSVLQVDTRDDKWDGVYTVLDTGPRIQGREIDIYMWSCYDALAFGKRAVRLTVLRLGWSPKATAPSFLEQLFGRPAN